MQGNIQKIFRHPLAGHFYKITVSVPNEEVPATGFPVLYILDGNAYGTMCEEILKLQWRRAEKTYISPMIIVSIGYELDEVFPALRVYDFTPSYPASSLPDKPDGTSWPAHGGAKEFLDLLEEEIQPFVTKQVPVDLNNQILFGHSLGGLFVLYVLFERPELFRNYLCCSPSIWWNDREILIHERKTCLFPNKKLYIAAEKVEKGDMFENSLMLYQRLKAHHPDFVSFTSPVGENHMSIVPAIFSEAMRFFYK
ncbi:alpha/beta hydrolase-fold protein [Mammaliicoccus sciuri]|nr:alpha/beta hydrolase-fold protein [Sporosarcina newyorkensis]